MRAVKGSLGRSPKERERELEGLCWTDFWGILRDGPAVAVARERAIEVLVCRI